MHITRIKACAAFDPLFVTSETSSFQWPGLKEGYTFTSVEKVGESWFTHMGFPSGKLGSAKFDGSQDDIATTRERSLNHPPA